MNVLECGICGSVAIWCMPDGGYFCDHCEKDIIPLSTPQVEVSKIANCDVKEG